MKVKEFLTEERWVKDYLAVDATGRPEVTISKAACRFCIMGALDRCYEDHTEYGAAFRKLTSTLGKLRFTTSIAIFNDDPKTTYADVKRVLEEADV